jgi:hypothetical protein
MLKSFVLELHGEWSEFTDECIGPLSPVDISTAGDPVLSQCFLRNDLALTSDRVESTWT